MILHWLGPMFDPALEGYWGSSDLDAATDTFLEVIAAHPDKVDGIKVSLLDARREVDLRRRLPQGVRCYTGDDFHYPELIAGDEQGFSHALLGIFDPLGPLAAEAVRVLDTGNVTGFRELLDPTVELSRHLFEAPPASTRRAWSSWPGWPATRTTSPWSAASSRPVPCRTWPAPTNSPTASACSRTQAGRGTDADPAGDVRSDPVTADLTRFSVNQMTVKQLSLPELADACAALGIRNVGLWREPVQAYGVEAAAKLMRDAGLTVTTLCRGGFLTDLDPVPRAEALGDNHAAIDEAATLGTDTLVLVSGGLPPGSKDLHGARERIADALAVLAPTPPNAASAWPSSRCTPCTPPTAVSSPPSPRPSTWPNASRPNRWASRWTRTTSGGTTGPRRDRPRGRLRPHPHLPARRLDHPLPEGVLNGRGQLGDGTIDLRTWRTHVESAGYTGPIEVELFNEQLWSRDGREVLKETTTRFLAHAM